MPSVDAIHTRNVTILSTNLGLFQQQLHAGEEPDDWGGHRETLKPVSYTHLTLPTIDDV